MKRILVAIDGSPRESLILRTALDLAERVDARLILYRAVGIPPELPPAALAVHPDDVPRLLEDIARRHLEELAARLPDNRRGGVHVDLGVAWRGICDAARAERADLIVIGSHGYSDIDRIIGTTAAKVVNHADRSVMVVRQPPN
jgi:nucleotide-binding universal stress UspA family protein